MTSEYNESKIETLQEPLETHQQAKSHLHNAIEEIDRLSDALSVDESIKQDAIDLYKKCMSSKLSYYPSIAELAAGCIYVTCRSTQTPRTRNDIAEESVLSETRYGWRGRPIWEEGKRTELGGGKARKVNRSYRIITEELGLSPSRLPISDFVQEYCNRLSASDETLEIASVVVKKVEYSEDLHSGSSAGALAAGILDYSTNISESDITQKEISEVTCFTDTTVRLRRKEIESLIE